MQVTFSQISQGLFNALLSLINRSIIDTSEFHLGLQSRSKFNILWALKTFVVIGPNKLSK
jgi:hypothetical protein